MSNWSAVLYNSVKRGNTLMWDITDRIRATWKRSTRAVGGYWLGTADYMGTRDDMLEMFQDGMMREIREDSGGMMTWQGYIAEMELNLAGVKYVRSMVDTANAVKVMFTRIGDSLITNGSAESGPWTAYHSATVTQSSINVWSTLGNYSCKIVTNGTGTLPAGARINGSGYSVTIVAEAAYEIGVSINVLSGSWRISVNRSDTDASLAKYSTKGAQGVQNVKINIPATNTYAGPVDFRITAEETGAHSAWTIYGDAAYFRLSPVRAETGWSFDLNSQAEYGRLENIILDVAMAQAQANSKVATTLKKQAWPKTLPPNEFSLIGADIESQAGNVEDKLTLTVHGYAHTLANKYSTVTGTAAASVQMNAIMAQCEFISGYSVSSNAIDFQIDERAPIRHWQIIKDIIAAGDASGNRWIGGVGAGRFFSYGMADNVIAYRYRGGRFYHPSGGELEPWFAEPGHLLYLDDAPIGPSQISGVAEDDPHNLFVAEIEMGPPTDQYPNGTLAFRHEAT